MKWILVLTIGLAYFACVDDSTNTVLSLDEMQLDKRGKYFVEQFKKKPGWENIWQDLNKDGILEVNKAIMNSAPDYGIHYLVPILNADKTVDKIALFPLDIKQGNLQKIIPLKILSLSTKRTREISTMCLLILLLDFYLARG